MSGPTPRELAAGFHDAECAGYRADLPYWQELAAAAAGEPVLDLGAGTGRVAVPLAAEGHDVVAVDLDPLLLEELAARAAALGAAVRTVAADLTALAPGALGLERPAAVAMIPMQTIQLLGGPQARRAALAAIAAHCRPGAVLAVSIVPRVEPFDGRDASPLLLPPDLARIGAWRFESTPLAVLQPRDGDPIEMHRRRRALAADGTPAGDAADVVITLDPVTPAELQAEAAAAGWEPAGVTELAATEEHSGGLIVRFVLPDREDRPR